jgi:hypothetical protein
MLVKLENGSPIQWPVSEMSARFSVPNTSLPESLTTDVLGPLGYGLFAYSDAPTFNGLTQKVEERTPAKQGDTWVQQWEVVELYGESEREQVLAKAEKNKLESQASNIRYERNSKLAASDWTQLADSTADKAAWATHRQALRDITAQAGFPWAVDWPVQP